MNDSKDIVEICFSAFILVLIASPLCPVQFCCALLITLILFNHSNMLQLFSCLLLFSSFDQDEEEAEAAFNQKHALQKAKEVGPLSSFMSSE